MTSFNHKYVDRRVGGLKGPLKSDILWPSSPSSLWNFCIERKLHRSWRFSASSSSCFLARIFLLILPSLLHFQIGFLFDVNLLLFPFFFSPSNFHQHFLLQPPKTRMDGHGRRNRWAPNESHIFRLLLTLSHGIFSQSIHAEKEGEMKHKERNKKEKRPCTHHTHTHTCVQPWKAFRKHRCVFLSFYLCSSLLATMGKLCIKKKLSPPPSVCFIQK